MEISKILSRVKKSYPELRNVNIKVIIQKKAKFAARAYAIPPANLYIMWINHSRCKDKGRKELTGMIAHELAHHVQLKSNKLMFIRAPFQLVLPKKSSLWKKWQRRIEREADEITIKRGFGKELLANYIYKKKHNPEIYKRACEIGYLTIEEIKEHIRLM